ncbi:hypothetical protein, partial [Vibrio sp. 624788]|uniref:hypothetical protein n=1 Tax=Vibrio sp. 624788 TaxID=1234362 RepID=UPI0019D3EF3E
MHLRLENINALLAFNVDRWVGIAFDILAIQKQNQHNYLTLMDSLNLTNELADERQALNINNSSNKISRKLFENLLTRVIDQLGKNAKLKIYIYIPFS